VTVRRDVEYRRTEAGALTMDLYSPPDAKGGERRPAVVFVFGYPDPGFEAMLGCKQKDMGSYVSWGRLAAASGLIAVTYTNRDPAADLDALLDYLRQNAASLGIDESRIGIWACSGHVPLALSVLMRGASDSFKCAVLCYGFMLDLEGSTAVAEAAARFMFANPGAGRSVDDLPQELPLFVVRAGRDETPRLNESLDRFMAAALARNLPVTFANHTAAPHAFDLLDTSETSREMIRRILSFLRLHLVG
jgi:acetyl esterase/lipase